MKNRLVSALALATAMATSLLAQAPKIKCNGPLKHTDVVRFLHEQVPPKVVIQHLEACGVDYDLTPEREEVLKAMNAGDALIGAVRAAAARRRTVEEAAARRKQAEAAAAQRKALEDAAWEPVKDERDVTLIAAFLKNYPDGVHAAEAKRRIDALTPKLGVPVVDRWGLQWVPIPAGSFEMGCSPGDADCADDEKPGHAVALTKPFWLMTTEVTIGHFRASELGLPVQPAWNTDARQPVVNVTWDDASAFCRVVGGRLPTEAEWEDAARGGRTGSRYPSGSGVSQDDANFAGTGSRDQWDRTAPTGSFAPNGFGLFDVAGNVWEWVADWYDAGFYQTSPKTDPPGPLSGSARVVRGGSWDLSARHLRVSVRYRFPSSNRESVVGFRCARDRAPGN